MTSAKSDYGIYVKGNDLTIQGSGSLDVTAGTEGSFSDGIYSNNNIVISGATVTATGRNATNTSRGICAGYQVTIQNGANVTAVGGNGGRQSYGIWCDSGITINHSTCKATANESSKGTKQAIYISNKAMNLINAHLTSGSENGTSAEWIPQN